MTCGCQPWIYLLSLSLIDNLVFGIREHETGIEIKFAPSVTIAYLPVESLVGCPRHIDRWGANTKNKRNVIAVNKLVVAFIIEIIDGQWNTVPQVHVKTDVKLTRFLPCHIVITERTFTIALKNLLLVISKIIWVSAFIHLIVKIAVAHGDIRTYQTIWSAYFH